MTRGQIIAITDDTIFTTTEFNGGMYYEEGGYGEEVIEGLKKASTIEKYKAFARSFNQEHFQYKEQIVYDLSKRSNFNYDTLLDFTEGNYFDKWFSDYLYFKNYGSKPVELITKTHIITIQPNGITMLNFGEVCEETGDYSVDITLNPAKGIIETIEEQGWWVSIHDEEIEIGQPSPLGEDFFFIIDNDDIVANIRRYAADFDPDEHARDLIVNGCDRRVKDLAEDAEVIAEMLDNLVDAIAKFD